MYIFIFSWSLQQRLFAVPDNTTQLYSAAEVYMDKASTLITTIPGPNTTNAYVFRSYFGSWSLQQRLTAANGSSSISSSFSATVNLSAFSNPTLWGGSMVYRTLEDVHIRTQYHNGSCLRIWMSDHFHDGWDSAVLTVRAPDLTNDTFQPQCNQVKYLVYVLFFVQV